MEWIKSSSLLLEELNGHVHECVLNSGRNNENNTKI